MAPLLQRFRKGRSKQKDDAKQQGKDFPVKIRVVGAPADRDPDLSLRLSTTQEELLKDLSLYVKENDAPAPAAGQAAATATAASTASPSANTAATVPVSPLEGLEDTPDGANKGSTAPNTSMSMNVPTNLVGNISAIARQSEEETIDLNDKGRDDDSACSSEAIYYARTGHRAARTSNSMSGGTKTKAVVPTTAQSKTHGARPRSLRDAFDSATDAKIFGDAEDLHGDPEFARRNSASGNSNGPDSTSVGGFSSYGGMNDTTTSSVGKERLSHTSRSARKKATAASTSSNKARTTDVSVNHEQDAAGSSYEDSYSFNESYEEEYGKMTLYEELIDFFFSDCAVPTHGGDRDRRSRSSAATGRRRRRRGSSSRRSDQRRPPRDDGSRGRSSASSSRRHK